MRILVIEDEPKVARSLVKGLEAEHFTVDLAVDGEDGLRIATQVNYDGIVLDWNLPRLDGLTLLRKLRQTGSSSRVLILSGRREVSDRVYGLEAGADDYLIKPFSFQELLARLHTLLASSVDGTQQPADTTLPPALAPRANEMAPLNVDAASIRRLESELAAHIGPFAEYAVRHAAHASPDIDALLDQLGKQIDSEPERQQFVDSARQWLPAASGTPFAQGALPTSEASAEFAVGQQKLATEISAGAPETLSAPAEARAARLEASLPVAEAPPAASGAAVGVPQAPVDENVQFTVFRPRELVPDEWQPLLAFTHLASASSDVEVKRQAQAVLKHAIAEYRQVVQDAQDAVPRDEVLTLVPKVPGVEFEPAERGFPCRGTVHLEMFLARALPQLPAQTARGKLSVHLGKHAIAELPLTMVVAAPRTPDAARAQS